MEKTEIKLKISNPYAFLLGDIHQHVDTVLRDKGAMHGAISEAIMQCPQPKMFSGWLEKQQRLINAVDNYTKLKRAEINGDDGRYVHNAFCDVEEAMKAFYL